MKFTDEQLCIIGIFILAFSSLLGLIWAEGPVRTILATIPQNVISGLLGYITKGATRR